MGKTEGKKIKLRCTQQAINYLHLVRYL